MHHSKIFWAKQGEQTEKTNQFHDCKLRTHLISCQVNYTCSHRAPFQVKEGTIVNALVFSRHQPCWNVSGNILASFVWWRPFHKLCHVTKLIFFVLDPPPLLLLLPMSHLVTIREKLADPPHVDQITKVHHIHTATPTPCLFVCLFRAANETATQCVRLLAWQSNVLHMQDVPLVISQWWQSVNKRHIKLTFIFNLYSV
jgi:hypothetical protein